MQVKGNRRLKMAVSLIAMTTLVAVAFVSWGQFGQAPNQPSRSRSPSRQQLQNLEIVSKLKTEQIHALAMRGQYVYVSGIDTLIAVYDISNPQNIRKVGELPFNLPEGQYGHVEELKLVGNYAYAQTVIESSAGYTVSLKIIDISNPTNPREVGQYAPASGYLTGFVIGNNYAYVGISVPSRGITKLHVLNISNPANPQFIREVTDVPSLEGDGGVVAGNRLYLVHGLNGMSVWNIIQPDNPQRLGAVDTPGVARSVAVSGNYAFVADGKWTTTGAERGYLRVVDVSNPANPQIVNSVATEDDNPWFPMVLAGNTLYVGGFNRNNTQIFDITNPSSPSSVGTIQGLLSASDVSSNRIATRFFGTDFIVWDITNRTSPNRFAQYSGLSPTVTALKDEYLITTLRTGLVVFNATNPAQLQRVSKVDLPDLPSHFGIRLTFAGDLAIVSHSNYTTGPKLYFVNFSNPTNPQLLGTNDLGQASNVYDIAVIKDRYLYVGHTDGCEIFDLTTRTKVGSFGFIGSVLGVAGQGDIACLVQSQFPNSVLKFYDTTDPVNPSLISQLTLNERLADIEMVGSLVFFVTQKANLFVIDVSDPNSPQQVASWTNPNAPQFDTQVRITISGNFAYLAVSQSQNGLIVLDLSDLPNRITKVASFTGRSCRHASTLGNLVYLAADDGLYVLRNLLMPQVLPPTIFAVSPRTLTTLSDVTLRVEGANFQSGAQVWLERANQRLNPTRATVVGGNIIYAQFDLSSATLGRWDVVVRNPDGNIARRSEAITIVQAPDLTLANLRLEPSANLQDGAPVNVKVTARNTGGIRANFVVQFLAGSQIIGEETVSLAGGAEAEVSLPWRVVAGNYQIRAVADPTNAVLESNETNNEATLPINLPLPDLTVTSLTISPSSNLVDGQQIEVQFTIANQGGGTSRPIALKLLIDEGNYDERTIYEGLGPNRTQTFTFRHYVSAGQKQISVIVDPANSVSESNETNNRRDLSLPEIPRPDVAITNLRTYPSTNLSPGMNIQIIATIHNFGGATVRRFAIAFNAAGSNLGSWVTGIGVNESKEVEVTWRNIPAGQHTILATVDPYNALPDLNRANNQATTIVEVTPPDFIVEGMEIRPSRAVSGATVTVVAFVRISGVGRTPFPIPVRLYDNDVPAGEAQIEAGIPAGQRLTLRIPYHAKSGQRRLKVVVDPDNRVSEPNETNNSAEQTLDVPAPDVALNVTVIPDNPQTGQPFFVRGTVRNNGETTVVPFEVTAEVLDENNRVVASNRQSFPNGMAGGASSDLNLGFTRFFEMKRVRVKVNWSLTGFQDANPSNDEAIFNLPDVAPPDFALTNLDVQLPAIVGMGRTVTFRVSVTNRGGSYRLTDFIGVRGAGVPVFIFLNDQYIATAFFGALDANATTTTSASWVIDRPFTNPTIRAIIDPNRQFPDSDRTNNEAQRQIEATVQKLDLVPIDVQITPANQPVGSSVDIQVRVRKEGVGDYFGRVPVRVFVDEERLENFWAQASLTDANPETVISLVWSVKSGSERNIRVVLDPENVIDEQNETNNTLERTINYPATAPDFVVESVDYSPKENVRQGDLVVFTANIRNKGGAYRGGVPVRLRLNTGFERTVYVYYINANEVRTVRFVYWESDGWTAVPGSDHQVTVDVDPYNQIPESDEANNRLAQLLPLVVASRPIVWFSWVSYPPSDVAPGAQFSLDWTLNNSGAQTVPVTVSVLGLPEGWAQVEPAAGTLPANGILNGKVTVSIPSNWAEEREFNLTLQTQANGITVRAERRFKVETRPVISGLTPYNGSKFGSTTVEFSWYTQIPSTSEVFIKRPVDANWQRFVGEPGTFHKVVVSGLRRNSTYLFYVKSVSPGGESRSEERRIFVTNAVTFDSTEYTAEVRRDYDQRLTVYVVNNDRVPHTIKAELVDNPYQDAPAGLLGEGTFDEPARLSPGQRLAITFAAHFQDAQREDYTFRIRVRTLDEPIEQVDEATVKIRVRPPDVRIRVVQVAEDPLTMVKTFRVTNEGTDPATDLTIDPQGLAAEQVGMQPLIQHAYLAPGQSIEFKIYPILLPPDFRPFTLSDVSSVRLTFENSVGFIGWNFRPFDLYIKVNEVEVGSLQNMIPIGVFTFNIPPQVILPPNQFGRSIANRMANSDIVPIPQEEMQPIVQKLREGVTLKVSYANQSQQVPVQFLSARQAHGQFFAVNKGPRTMRQEVAASHCTNQPRLSVTFNNGIINAQLEILKNNFNDAHWVNVSNFTLDICTNAFWVGVRAPDEATARVAAENKCNVQTKQPPKPNTVVVTLVGDGPPFKRGKPVKVRARVMGEGDISITAVQASFSNGDAPIFLRPVSGNIFEGTWVPTTVPSNFRVESDGSIIFPVTVMVIAQGCEQQATDSQTTEVRIGRIKFKFTGITEVDPNELEQRVNIPDEPWLRWNWSPGQQKFIHFRGLVVDEEDRPIPAAVSVEFRFTPMGEPTKIEIEEQQVYAQDGKFLFTFPAKKLALKEPGQLRAVFEARSQEIPSLRARKFISGVLLGEFQFKATKENYLFWEAEVRGRKEKEQPVKVSATAGVDIKELEISVLALQLDENGRLTWKPLEGASVELLGSGVIRKTDRNGSLIWKISPGGETVSINFYLVPELEIKAVSIPRGYIAHPEMQGKIYIFIGSKNGFEVTTDKDGNLQARTTKSGAFVVSDRRFKVQIVSGGGSLDGDIARPEQGNPIAHTITYHPPQAINEQVREVKLAIQDSEVELYKGELTFKVFKNAFITVSKLGFKEDVEPVPIDLVDINGVRAIPGIVKGKVQENPRPESGRPINGATVTAFVADQQKTTQSEGIEGPTAGRFTLENLAENKETLELRKPIILPFLDFVEDFAHSFDGLAQLGYRRPHFREQDGFVDFNNQPIFRYRWDLRYETDKEKLQRILDSIRRADAALKYTAEVDPMMKQYYKEVVAAFVDLVLFVASELKIFDKLAELMSVGRGIGKGVRLSQTARRYVKAEIEKFLKQQVGFYDPNLLDNYVDYVDDALRNHKGLTDEALDDIWKRVNDTAGQQTADAVKAALKNYRDNLSAAMETIVAQMKGDIVGYLKILLKKFGIKEYEPETGDPIDKAFFWMLDKTVDAVLNAVVQQFNLNQAFSIESISAIADQITELMANGQLTIDRLFFQQVIDVGFRTLGRYEIRGSTEQAIKNIETMRKGIDQYRNLYEVARAPFSKAIGAVKTGFQKVYESTAVMTGASPSPLGEFVFGFWETSADLTGSILDGILPIGSAATVLLGSSATIMLKASVPLAWVYAVGWSSENLPSELISPFFPFPIEYYSPFFPFPIERSPLLAYVNAGGSSRFTPIRSRSRQLSEYETVVNQIKSAIQNNNYEQVLQLAHNLAEATTAVSDAIQAKTAIVTRAFPIAHSQDPTFPARARQATDVAEASTFYRREFLLRVCSYLAGESDEAANKALQSADVALQKTQEAMGLLDGAIERLRSLNVTLPPLLRFTHQIQQVSLTEWRITFTAQNIGGQPSPATNVKFVATNGITVSPNSWNLSSLAPNTTQSITVIARTLQRFTNGFGVVRTTLGTEPNDFNVDFVPAIVFLTSKDEVPPAISDLTPKEDEIVRTTTPLISATVVDALSGLDVSSLKMTLDGQRVNATYDVATRKFSFRPTQPLSEGNHTVVVEATDLDGNTARKQWSFTIRLGAPVEITDLRISPNPFSPNGDGIDDVLNIHFKLSGDAVLTITVVDSQNRVVKTLANERQFSQGEHNLTWDGIKDDGQRAETGSYGVRIAIVREGRQQQVVEAQVTADTSPLSITGVSVTPETMRLAKDAATVNFNLSQNARVEVKVYMGESTNDDGYVVRSLVMENAQRGSNLVNWDGRADDGRFVPPGVYSIAIEADAGTNSNRIDLAGRITVRSLPDLMAASLISADQDGKTVLTATVRNIGAESARNIVVRFFVRDIVLGDKVVDNLDSGAEATVEFTIDPTRQVLVDENLALVVDPENSIDELEEFNNRLETRLQIQAVRLAHVLPAGISLVSVPIQLLDPNPQTAFGFSSPEETKVAWWDPQKQGDVKYRFANEIPALEPGKGYFVKLPSERTLQWTGMPTRTQDGNQYVINLQRGWNLIGLPRPGSVPLNNLTVRRANDQNAIAFTSPQNRLTEPYAWTYSNAERRYQLVYPEIGELGTFDAFKGYWVYAHEPCQLLIPAQSRSVYVARKRNQIEGWFFRVEAIAGEFTDSIVIGRNSTRLQAQKPPVSPDGQPVRLSILDEHGRSWGALVSNGNGRMVWKLLLEADRSVEKVTLRFPDLGYLPKDLGVYLIDEGTGQRRYLRTTGSVTFNLTSNRGETERKVLQLAIVPGATGLLKIVGLKAEPMRGRGFVVQFALTRPAQTQVEVLTLTGRKVAVIESGQSRSAGRHQIIWQGQSGNGQMLPASAYVIRVTATDEEGRQVQATTVARPR